MGRGDQRLTEVTAGEHGHTLVQHPPEVVHPPLPHQRQRREPLRVIDVVEHPQLVVGAER